MDGKWVFTLQVPSMTPFLQYSERRDLREKLFTGYFMKGDNDNDHDNKDIIARIAKLRVEKALLLGYPSYSAFVLEKNMAKTPDRVFEFLNQVWDAARLLMFKPPAFRLSSIHVSTYELSIITPNCK